MADIKLNNDVLTTLNSLLQERFDAIEAINKIALNMDNASSQLPKFITNELKNDDFSVASLCGKTTDANEQTISGCVNTIGNSMKKFIAGIVMTDTEKNNTNKDVKTLNETTNTVTEDVGQVTTDDVTNTTVNENTESSESLDDIIDQYKNQQENPVTQKDSLGVVTVTKNGATIIDQNGNVIDNCLNTQYKVYEELKDANGNVIAVRISMDGIEQEQWIRMIQEGSSVGTYYEVNQVGSFNCSQGGLTIYDKDNNPIGVLEKGNHKVYAVTSNSESNITAIRISKEGEPEQWVQIYQDGRYIDGGVFEQYGVTYTNPTEVDLGNGSKATINSTKNKVLGGVLGVLVIGLGATIYAKKKQKDGNVHKDEEPLPEGDYNIYDYKEDENGNITGAKISEDGSDEEQWVEF